MRRVFWTEKALSHLDAIHKYISQNSPRYARRIVEKLLKRSEQIVFFPNSGRVVPEYEQPDIREVLESSYRLIYLVGEEQMDVLAVIHAKQQLDLNEGMSESD